MFLLFLPAPGRPVIIPEDCSAENNSVTIAWQPHPSGIVETFTLELDDGNSGDFRVSKYSFHFGHRWGKVKSITSTLMPNYYLLLTNPKR